MVIDSPGVLTYANTNQAKYSIEACPSQNDSINRHTHLRVCIYPNADWVIVKSDLSATNTFHPSSLLFQSIARTSLYWSLIDQVSDLEQNSRSVLYCLCPVEQLYFVAGLACNRLKMVSSLRPKIPTFNKPFLVVPSSIIYRGIQLPLIMHQLGVQR